MSSKINFVMSLRNTSTIAKKCCVEIYPLLCKANYEFNYARKLTFFLLNSYVFWSLLYLI
jgi:hypothetical protein